jgi:putative mRNA 3-end processing factor
MKNGLIETTPAGLYCEAGGFYIDPWEPVELAVITHAHSGRARPGSGAYLTSEPGAGLLRERLGAGAVIETAPYGRIVHHNGVAISLHPAGHIPGSAQVRVARRGEVWVASGDYKRETDGVSEPFEPVRCHTFLTEATYALPIYRWRPQEEIFAEIHAWWRANQASGRTSVLFGCPLGKAQRLMAGLDPGIGPILVHGAAARFLPAYEALGIRLPRAEQAGESNARLTRGRAIVIAPPAAQASPWLRKFGPVSTGFASGQMQIRGARRRRNVDRGFVLSDHADWTALLETIRATGAATVAATHGYARALARWLQENGWNARVLPARFEEEIEE